MLLFYFSSKFIILNDNSVFSLSAPQVKEWLPKFPSQCMCKRQRNRISNLSMNLEGNVRYLAFHKIWMITILTVTTFNFPIVLKTKLSGNPWDLASSRTLTILKHYDNWNEDKFGHGIYSVKFTQGCKTWHCFAVGSTFVTVVGKTLFLSRRPYIPEIIDDESN